MGPWNYSRNRSNFFISIAQGSQMCVCVCVCHTYMCVLGERVRVRRHLALYYLIVLLDAGVLGLEEVSSWLRDLTHCTPGC